MKAITIAGNVGKDAVVRTTQDGTKVTGWSVAVDDGFGDKKRTLWFDCNMWGGRGEKIADYLTKGTKVCVSGDLSTREYEGKTYLTVRVNDVTLQGGGQKDSGREFADPQHQRGYDAGKPGGGGGGGPDLDDSILFAAEWRA